MSVTCLEVLDDLVGVHRMIADVDDTSGFNGAGAISESYDSVVSFCFELNTFVMIEVNIRC